MCKGERPTVCQCFGRLISEGHSTVQGRGGTYLWKQSGVKGIRDNRKGGPRRKGTDRARPSKLPMLLRVPIPTLCELNTQGGSGHRDHMADLNSWEHLQPLWKRAQAVPEWRL